MTYEETSEEETKEERRDWRHVVPEVRVRGLNRRGERKVEGRRRGEGREDRKESVSVSVERCDCSRFGKEVGSEETSGLHT